MKLRFVGKTMQPTAENRLWPHIPKPPRDHIGKYDEKTGAAVQGQPAPMIGQGEAIEVPDDLGEWLLLRFAGDFELAVDEQAPKPTRNKMGEEPGVQK